MLCSISPGASTSISIVNSLAIEAIEHSCYEKLEDIVDTLESGEIDLEKSVELYEKGMILKNNCEEKLKKVELQIKQIKLENNQIKKKDFKK